MSYMKSTNTPTKNVSEPITAKYILRIIRPSEFLRIFDHEYVVIRLKANILLEMYLEVLNDFYIMFIAENKLLANIWMVFFARFYDNWCFHISATLVILDILTKTKCYNLIFLSLFVFSSEQYSLIYA